MTDTTTTRLTDVVADLDGPREPADVYLDARARVTIAAATWWRAAAILREATETARAATREAQAAHWWRRRAARAARAAAYEDRVEARLDAAAAEDAFWAAADAVTTARDAYVTYLVAADDSTLAMLADPQTPDGDDYWDVMAAADRARAELAYAEQEAALDRLDYAAEAARRCACHPDGGPIGPGCLETITIGCPRCADKAIDDQCVTTPAEPTHADVDEHTYVDEDGYDWTSKATA